MAYCGYITTVKELRKHTNADRLQIATIFGNDVIVDMDVSVGDLGVYFPTDGKLSEEYALVNELTRETGGYLDDKKRHVRAIKLRGERSDGLYMPLDSLSNFTDISSLKEGDTITTLNGVLICEKYIPDKKQTNTYEHIKKKRETENEFPFFEEHINTAQLAYNLDTFKEGDICYITLKLHGTSQRTAYTIKESKTKLHNFFNRIGVKIPKKKKWKYKTGTRRVILDNFEGGFYGSNKFREEWHDFFKDKLQKGEEVYYEVVGYADGDKLIMPECSNLDTKDKDFIREYGETTRFTYGCGVGQSDVYVYRMTMTNEDGHVVEYPTELVRLRCEQMGVKFVPVLDKFIFTTKEDLLERVSLYESGADPIGKTHIREGVIVRIENGQKFTALKHKNFHFKVIEGIIKDTGTLDIEEAQSSFEEVANG
ncbi:RNA ligase family protein [Bacillus mojavensis]